MARLTEEMVIARSKQSDLSQIKKLNCWGSELSDVSIIRRMHGVEVLALSVNKISTLADFENLNNLQELYLRKNNIQDINDLIYLQNLPKLKALWLEENPCVDGAGPHYRKIVLRALPRLQKLDNVEVTQEEVAEALRSPAPQQQPKREEVYEEQYNEQPNYQQQQQQPQQQQQQQYRQPSPVREQMQQSPENTESECNSDPNDRAPSIPSSPMQRSPPNPESYSPVENNNPSPRYQNGRGNYNAYERSPDESPMNYRERERAPIPSSMSTHSMKEYYHERQPPPQSYRHSQSDLTEWDEHPNNGNHPNYNTQNTRDNMRRSMVSNGGDRFDERRERDLYQYKNGSVSREDFAEDIERRRTEVRRSEGRFNDSSSVISNALLSHLTGIHRRPINRSSNLLSATLCLVKELDYPSLEVVEHAVRCRIDELAESL